MNELLKAVIFLGLSFVFSKLCLDFTVCAVVLTIGFIPISIILLSTQKNLSWFALTKRISVFIPTAVFTVYSYLLSTHHFLNDQVNRQPFFDYLFSIIIAINIAEAGVLAFAEKIKLNGFFSIVLALLTLKLQWSYTHNIYGFDDKIWILAYTAILGHLYVFTSLPFVNLPLLLIPIIGSLKFTHLWISYRMYSLYFFLVFLTVFKNHDKFSKSFSKIKQELRLPIVNHIWLFLNAIVLGYLVYRAI